MPRRHAFIMGPLAAVQVAKDTSYFLMRACVQQGHAVCHLQPHDLWLEHARLYARVVWLRVTDDAARPFVTIRHATVALDCMDVVWLRSDPPLDRRYFYMTLLLDYLPAATQVVNRPSGVRNWNEKLAPLYFPKLTPPTRVTNNPDDIIALAKRHGRVTVKPLDGFGGKGIIFYQAGDDPAPLHAALATRHWVVAQQYLPAATAGDKRILLLQGEPLGAILRVHAVGVELNNLDAGGQAIPAKLTARDRRICTALKPALQREGIFFAGIDIIGGLLIEVNVTSPTGLQELCRFTATDFHHEIVRALGGLGG